MNRKQRVSTGTPWESSVGYCRAIRIENHIEISGTTAVDDNGIVAPGNAKEQTRFVLSKIESSLQQLDSSLLDVIRTRIFVTDISQWEVVGKIHGQFFDEIRPVTTMVEVSRLIDPDLVVEIEATAFVGA